MEENISNASINKAYVTSLDKILTISEIKNSPEFNDIKQNLKCATPNCEVDLAFVSRNETDYLRIYPNQNHSIECLDFFEREARQAQTRIIGTITGTLSTDDFTTRNKSFFKKLYTKDSDEPQKKRKKTSKTTDPNKKQQEVVEINIKTDGSGAIINTDNDPDNPERKVGPRLKNRELNQLSDQDKNVLVKSNGYIDQIHINEGKSAKIYATFNKHHGIFYLTESFFNSGRISSEIIFDYLKIIQTYIEKKDRPKIQLITTCEPKKVAVDDTPHELEINDYAWTDFVVETTPNPIFINFPNLVARISYDGF